MKVDMWLNGLAVILFLGFFMAALIAFSTIDKQKEIVVSSRYGRQTGTLEIVYVNVALLLVAAMLYFHSYRFLPALAAFVLLIFFNSRMQSGIAPRGIFVGTTFLEWSQLEEYHILNDEISTIEVQVYANRKRYVLRCSKEERKQIEQYFVNNGVRKKQDRVSD
ncbi:MAG: DUF5673 domain-containing protein [Clostridiales bacterium]|nr:DUF5673 domain-containing protein [Clostridiales bacterium]